MRITPALLALALAAPALGADSGRPVGPGEVRQGLFGACYAGERDGWVVGELGRVFHTADGGATWYRQEVATKRPFLAVACVDAETAWIAGKEGIVYRTTDAGRTWTLVPTGSNRHVFTLQFATPQRGHGAGDFGTMVHTEDGGKTWTTQTVPPDVQLPESALDTGVDPGDVNLYALSFGDPDHAWLVGEFGTVLASADGGRTWKQQHSPVESTLFGVHFVDAQRGWAVGIDSVILRTEDGGASWRAQPPPVAQRSFYDVFVAGEQGWIVGNAGTAVKSVDGGATWQTYPLPIELAANWIRSVWLLPSGRGIAVGAEGLAFRVKDGGLERIIGERSS
jgi:photosystem II stability/assembly factor-like uncharacterized protein